MAIKFFAPEVTYKQKAKPAKKKTVRSASTLKSLTGDLETSSDVTGLELRLLPPYIITNTNSRLAIFNGLAKLYCLVVVVSDADNQLVSGIDLQGFPRIGKKEHLPINKTIYYWQKGGAATKAPNQIHVMCTVIRSKKDLREVGKILTELKTDTDYKDLLGTIAKMAKNATGVGAAMSIFTQVSSIVGKYLGDTEDKPLGTFVNSFTVIHGDFDKKGSNRIKLPTRNIDFELELTIRDAAEEKAKTKALTKSLAASADESVNGKEKVKVDMKWLK